MTLIRKNPARPALLALSVALGACGDNEKSPDGGGGGSHRGGSAGAAAGRGGAAGTAGGAGGSAASGGSAGTGGSRGGSGGTSGGSAGAGGAGEAGGSGGASGSDAAGGSSGASAAGAGGSSAGTSSGGSAGVAGAGAGGDGGEAGSGTEHCGTVMAPATSIEETQESGELPAPMGGAVGNGTYVLVEWNVHPPAQADADSHGAMLRFDGESYETVDERGVRESGTFSASGVVLLFTPDCPEGTARGVPYTLSGLGLSLSVVSENRVEVYTRLDGPQP